MRDSPTVPMGDGGTQTSSSNVAFEAAGRVFTGAVGISSTTGISGVSGAVASENRADKRPSLADLREGRRTQRGA